jgi:hypothetical protein
MVSMNAFTPLFNHRLEVTDVVAPKSGNKTLKIALGLFLVVIISLSLFVALSCSNNFDNNKTDGTVAKSLEIEWQQYLPGVSSDYVIQTSDSGYLVLGQNVTINPDTSSFSHPTSLVIKTDSSGKPLWAKTFSAQTEIAAAMPNNVLEVSDGYVFSGNSIWGFGVFIFKTSFDGDLIWSKVYLREPGESVGVYGLLASHEGGYTMLCSIPGAVNYPWIVKVDSFGNLQWNKTIALTGNISSSFFMPWVSGSPRSIVQTDDNGYAILCTVGHGGTSPLACELIKTDSEGILQWYKTYGGEGEYYQLGARSMTSTNGGYLIACQNGTRDTFIIKTDFKGNVLWNKTYTCNYLPIFISSVASTRNGGFVMLGSVFDQQVAGITDLSTKAYTWVAVADKDGNVLAQKVIKMATHDAEIENIIQANDGGYVFVGVWNKSYLASYEQKIWLVKLTPL